MPAVVGFSLSGNTQYGSPHVNDQASQSTPRPGASVPASPENESGAGVVAPVPDWPSLWAREPGLRPDGFYVAEIDGRATIQDERSIVDDIPPPPDRVAALCRDAAVRFIEGAPKPPFYLPGMVIDRDRETGELVIGYDKGVHDFEFQELGSGKTLDEAAFSASSALLDARDAAKAGGNA